MNAVTDTPVTEMPAPFVFTDAAADKVKQLIEEEGNADHKLRVYVTGGGCSGFQYGFTFDEAVNEDDTVVERRIEGDDSGKDLRVGEGATKGEGVNDGDGDGDGDGVSEGEGEGDGKGG